MADVVLTPTAQAEFTRLPRPIQIRVLGIINRLRKWPNVSGAKALGHDWAGHVRIRTGDYRVIFAVDETADPVVVTIVRITNRDGAYDN